MFRVIVSNAARKGAKKMPKEMKEKVLELLDVLESTPIPVDNYDIKKMKGLKNTYRIRIGDYRVVYQVDFSDKVVSVIKIEKREVVYK